METMEEREGLEGRVGDFDGRECCVGDSVGGVYNAFRSFQRGCGRGIVGVAMDTQQ